MPSTDRLYYNDARLRTFEATVLRTERRDGHTAVWLDRTAFYPTSGGQPFDRGTIDAVPVVDVQEDEHGDVMHVLSGSAPALHTAVRGEIDWVRRFDHMQQHTGQHLLSAVLEHAFGARTIGFHLGSDMCTIDLDRELSSSQIARGEAEANDAVWQDRVVSIRYVTDDEARNLPLRKESVRTGTLRLVEIEGTDLSACGGTHVDRTGCIGLITITSWERFKGGQRLEFLCGGRALRRFQQMRDTLSGSVRLLSVLPAELPGAIERLQTELKEQKRALGAAQRDLAGYEAVALAGSAESLSIGRAVLQAVDGDALRLKALAAAVAARPGHLAVLVSRASPALAVAARAADVPVSCHELVTGLTKRFGGRGGGKPDLAQCGGLQGSAEEILAAARAALGH